MYSLEKANFELSYSGFFFNDFFFNTILTSIIKTCSELVAENCLFTQLDPRYAP